MKVKSIGKHSTFLFVFFLYACAALQFIRFYVRSTTSYLNMSLYLSGRERLPFQERVFPILILKPLTDSAWVRTHFAHATGVFTLERGPFYLLSLIAFVVAAIYTQRLHDSLTEKGVLRALVFPVFLFAVMFTYAIHSEANFSYPYDLPSLAFFTAGLFYLYQRRFVPLFFIILAGTFNRETTLFLIALYVIDAATAERSTRFDLRRVPWGRVALLAVVWLAIKLALAHRFAGNDASESFLRVHDNLRQLRPRLLPALLNVCGYTLPIVLVLRQWLFPIRFRNYLWVVPLWFAVMFCSGVLVETRIYGELCSFSAVALVLVLERQAAVWSQQASTSPSNSDASVVTLDPKPAAA